MKITLDLTPTELERIANLIAEKGMEIQDEGNEGHPDARLTEKVYCQLISQTR